MASRFLNRDIFLEAGPLARRAAQVRSARAVRLLRAIGLDRADLEQEALISVWRAVSRFDPSRASLRTYVERIVESTVTTVLRRTCTQKRTPKAMSHSEPLQILVNIELRMDLDRILNGISANDRRLARLLAEHTPAEVARIVGTSRPTVYRSIIRIRCALSEAGLRRNA